MAWPPPPNLQQLSKYDKTIKHVQLDAVAETSKLAHASLGIWCLRRTGAHVHKPEVAQTIHVVLAQNKEPLAFWKSFSELNSRHSCHCGFQTSPIRTSVFCVAKKKELELSSHRTHQSSVRVQFNTCWPDYRRVFFKTLLWKHSWCMMIRRYFPIRYCMKIEIFALDLTKRCRWLMIISQPANLKHHVYVLCKAGHELLIFSSEVKMKWSSCRSEISPVQLHF